MREPAVELVRRYIEDWLGTGDASVCEQILHPDYTLHIAGTTLAGRDAYIAATRAGLLDPWPEVQVSVHEVVCSGDWVAASLTEHGTRAKDGKAAAWRIITLFRSDSERLVEAWAEEDYAGRRRQLAVGAADPVEPATAHPWAAPWLPSDPAAEQAVRSWLGHDAQVDALFSAGTRVAFHTGDSAEASAGIVCVRDGQISGRVIVHRSGPRAGRKTIDSD